MIRTFPILLICITFLGCTESRTSNSVTEAEPLTLSANYPVSRTPLQPSPYLELPLGSIKPEGWLKDQLIRMSSGMTGNLDEIYPEVVGSRNGWLGGDGDGWERGPYWIDGLLPLAYILDDEVLKSKVKKWVDWTINNQTEEGYIGPVPFEEEPEYEPGLQRGDRMDWWPKMVMLKILQQYYNATGDERVIKTLTRYFKYQLNELPNRPLDQLTLWANRRGGDNLLVVYWLYDITGETFLLDLGEIIQEQTFPWTTVFLNEENHNDPQQVWQYSSLKRYPFDTTEINTLTVSKIGGLHTVNFAQGLKEPVVNFRKDGDSTHISAVKKALKDIKKYHGQAQGMYGGDEPLHGPNPVQGIEFCSISEEMYSLETMLQITGDMEFADLLEKITYNALPTQASDDYSSRQYFQAANQIEISERMDVAFQNQGHEGTDFVFGTLSGYPCCTTNMHQSWPKFVQNLFYATPDGGVAALQYAPSTVRMKVADGVEVTIKETTGYPFREEVNFEFALPTETTFPFHLRIPAWANGATLSINGQKTEMKSKNGLAVISRLWKNGDKIQLQLPMELTTSLWHEFSTAVERGPLVYALRVDGEERKRDRGDHYRSFTEIYPTSPWNYGLIQKELDQFPGSVEVVENNWDGSYPWNLENAPVILKMKGFRVPEWKAENGVPYFPAFWGEFTGDTTDRIEEITLVPYGCTTLRISQFPTYRLP